MRSLLIGHAIGSFQEFGEVELELTGNLLAGSGATIGENNEKTLVSLPVK
jgi:hypothetical protein